MHIIPAAYLTQCLVDNKYLLTLLVACCEVVVFVVAIVVDLDAVNFPVVTTEFAVVVTTNFSVVVTTEFSVVLAVVDVGGGGVDIDVVFKTELDFIFWLLLDWLGVGWIVLVNSSDDEVKRVAVSSIDDLGVTNSDENIKGEVSMDDFTVLVFCEVGKTEVTNEADDIDVIILLFEEDIVNELSTWTGVSELDINELNITSDDPTNVEVGCELELMCGEEVDKISVLEEVTVTLDKVFV